MTRGVGAYLLLKDNKPEEALSLVSAQETHTHSILLRAHILLALKRTQEAWTFLVEKINEPMLKSLDWL